MDQLPDFRKAGLSETLPHWTQGGRQSKWLRQAGAISKALLIALVLILGGYTVLKNLFLVEERLDQGWKLHDGLGGNLGDFKSSKGSQYLLGVGKADITG